ncbi:class I SAM-dependent methyltransferase [Metabacillus halosaccharovorans]|uniref:class I SAM-dependent methyltransferase n=1 Tax=Metabacillus halosaccharovorans TaxID=930124 RepID=UPI002040B47F|nr:class I SAM-dependent methyltransferase [Metabacillus halosaccharovorans]MCM3443816.1 class I SAM-dependent methyltransferase [Metabacillus halosaccharovorans]
MSRLDLIRKEEKKYHDFCYENYKLFEEGSWLYKPVKTVMDLLPLFNNHEDIRVLDLGSGVGRNSIPIAQEIKNKNGKVVCIDLLDSALDKLKRYSAEYEVEEIIETRKADIGHYEITKNEYDLIVAVSTLEHVESEDIFDNVIKQMALGTKNNGINCMIINSEVEEIEIESNKKLDAMMEVNLKTVNMINKLNSIYEGWEVLSQLVKPLEYQIVRNEREVLLKTNAITYVARKKK